MRLGASTIDDLLRTWNHIGGSEKTDSSEYNNLIFTIARDKVGMGYCEKEYNMFASQIRNIRTVLYRKSTIGEASVIVL